MRNYCENGGWDGDHFCDHPDRDWQSWPTIRDPYTHLDEDPRPPAMIKAHQQAHDAGDRYPDGDPDRMQDYYDNSLEQADEDGYVSGNGVTCPEGADDEYDCELE